MKERTGKKGKKEGIVRKRERGKREKGKERVLNIFLRSAGSF